MIVAGFGFRADAGTESLADALARAAQGHVPQYYATALDKAAQLEALIGAHLPVVGICEAEITQQETMTRSAAALAARGIGSLAEAAALAGAGPGARLLGPRQISEDRLATCALARGGE